MLGLVRSGQAGGVTYSAGISRPVLMSVTTNLMQGGGVIGLRSYRAHTCLRKARKIFEDCVTFVHVAYLVAEATHARSDWLLFYLKTTWLSANV